MLKRIQQWLGLSELGEWIARAEKAEVECQRLRQQQNQWSDEQSLRLSEISMLRAQLQSAQAKLREQTDADLILVSAKIIAATLRGDKPSHEDVDLQRRLSIQQQQLAGAVNAYPNGLSALLGVGSFTNIFR